MDFSKYNRIQIEVIEEPLEKREFITAGDYSGEFYVVEESKTGAVKIYIEDHLMWSAGSVEFAFEFLNELEFLAHRYA